MKCLWEPFAFDLRQFGQNSAVKIGVQLAFTAVHRRREVVKTLYIQKREGFTWVSINHLGW
jgi:hypothetical protein